MDKDELYKLYYEEGLTQKEIADIRGVSDATIRYWMKKYNIKTRNTIQQEKILKINKEILHKLYCKERKTKQEIADKFNVSRTSIKRLIKKYKIKRTYDKVTKNELIDMYYNKKMTQKEIGEEINACRDTIRSLLNRYNIKTRGGKKTDKEFKQEVKELVGNEYTFLEKYKTAGEEILCRHNECGYEWEIQPNAFINARHRCPECELKERGNKIKKDNREFVKEIKELVGNEYTFLEEYKTAIKPILCKHNKCGNVYKVRPNTFLNGHRCPNCYGITFSKPASEIEKFLKNNNVNYQKEYYFNDCTNERYLRFDFAIFKNNKVALLIEYDGRLHFEPIEYFGGEEKFKKRRENDEIKNNYCKDNNIRLLRIPYWRKNDIEKILNDNINVDNKNIKDKKLNLFENIS